MASEEEKSLIHQLYWDPSTNTGELVSRFGFKNIHELIKVAGRLTVAQCYVCDGPVEARSRSEAKNILSKIEGHSGLEDMPLSEEHRSLVEMSRPDICWRCGKDRERHIQRQKVNASMEDDKRRNELKFMPYREYLRTNEWLERRMRAIRRAEHRCQACNTTGRLNVHHRTYERRGSEHDEDLIVLCAGCHQIFHSHGKLAKD